MTLYASKNMFDAWSWWWEGNNPKNKFIVERGGEIIFVMLLVVATLWHTWETKRRNNKIPGPRGLPVIGYVPMMSLDLHLRFTEVAKKYGPIFQFRLGGNHFVVVSSPSLAKEVLRDVDASLANRNAQVAAAAYSNGCQGLVFIPSGQEWRMNRKICVQELLGSTTLESYQSLRRREVRREVSNLYSKSKMGIPVNIREEAHATLLSILMTMLWGASLEWEERCRITDMFQQKMDVVNITLAKPNISDLFPILARFDLQRVERDMKRQMSWFESFLDSVIDQRMKERMRGANNRESRKDFLQVLLDLKANQDPKIPMNMARIKMLLTDMIFAGVPTTSVMIEWVMAALLHYPKFMKKSREEINKVVGINGIVEESHLPKLHYLHAVIKEVMRLYPFSPLVAPRLPSESCVVAGYTIPLGTKVIVNSWAIHRDPKVWENPLEFTPERFLKGSETWEFSGNDFRFLPFGSGRRGCAGISMAEKSLPYLVATFIHSFDWRMPEGIKIDLKEKLEFNLKKETPLVAIPTPRLSDPKFFT